MDEVADDKALEFFRDMVEPTVAEFLRAPTDRRQGCLASLCLSSMADHYFHARSKPEEGCVNENVFRKKVGDTNWAMKQVIGVANATKHVRPLPGRVGYDDVFSLEITCGNLRAGWPINGLMVMIEVEEGNVWLLSQIVEAAMRFWEERLHLSVR